MNKIEWKTKALKQLLKIDSRYRQAIRVAVDELTGFPDVDLDIKKLKGLESTYRIRIGVYRVIFEVIDGNPVIISIKQVAIRDERTYN